MLLQRIRNSLKFRYKNFRYRQLCAGAQTPKFDYRSLKDEGYYSQCGQDKWLLENVFNCQESGHFVDIGAHDGVSFSNTFRMEQLGWQGLAIEPIPEVFEQLQVNRRCTTINGCISDSSGHATFRVISGYAQMLSGLVDEYDERHLQRIEREISEHGGSCRDMEVACYRFDQLCDKHGLSEIDFLNLDVEGAELNVLKSIDFDAVNIRVLAVENNYADYRIPLLLRKCGFVLHSIVGDEIYVNSDNHPSQAKNLHS